MPAKRETFGLDLDDCVSPFDAPFRLWLEEEKGIYLVDRVEGQFAYSEAYPGQITEREAIDLIKEFTWEASVDMMKPYPGAVEAIEEISTQLDIHVITARPKAERAPTQTLVDKYIGEYVVALHMPNTGDEHSTASKATVCNEIGAIAHVDDSDSNVWKVIEGTNGATKGLLLKDEEHVHNGAVVHEDAIIIPDLMTVARMNEYRQEEGRWPKQSEIGSLQASSSDS